MGEVEVGGSQKSAVAHRRNGPCKVRPRMTKCLVASCLSMCMGTSIAVNLTEFATYVFVDIAEGEARLNCDPNLTAATLVYNNWWPGCDWVSSLADFDSGCGEPCLSAATIREMEALNRAHPGTLVHYPSRGADGISRIRLGGWWLPPISNGSALPPIVVLQHGFRQNGNMFRYQFAAFLLRKVGFGVLVANFRDHCYSDSSGTGTNQWGNAWPLDVLGGWDYATTDPDGVLGGARAADQVGLMGISAGGFAVSNAFGLEGRVPAAWVDAAVHSPEAVLANGLRKFTARIGLEEPSDLTLSHVFDRVANISLARGVDVNRHLPEKTLPLGPNTRRPFMLVQNKDDKYVPLLEYVAYRSLLSSMPEKYEVQGWETIGSCHGDTHSIDHLVQKDLYTEKLCQFWHAAFGLSTEGRCATLI